MSFCHYLGFCWFWLLGYKQPFAVIQLLYCSIKIWKWNVQQIHLSLRYNRLLAISRIRSYNRRPTSASIQRLRIAATAKGSDWHLLLCSPVQFRILLSVHAINRFRTSLKIHHLWNVKQNADHVTTEGIFSALMVNMLKELKCSKFVIFFLTQ